MATQTVNLQPTQTSFLHRVLQGNAIYCMLGGLALVAGANPIGRIIGAHVPALLMTIGAVMIVYGGGLFIMATRQADVRRLAILATILDFVWVAGSAEIILAELLPMTTAGRWLIILAAEGVAAFAALQIYGLWKIRREHSA